MRLLTAALIAAPALAIAPDGALAHARYLASFRLETRQNLVGSRWGVCGQQCSIVSTLESACNDVTVGRRRGVEECRSACNVSYHLADMGS